MKKLCFNYILKQKIEKKFSNENRLATYYNESGIIKYQKNFGQNNIWKINL